MNSSRKPLIAGNWKMNTDLLSAGRLAAEIAAEVGQKQDVETLLCPPFVYLSAVGKVVAGSYLQLGGQNLYFEKNGAFTGEVSAAMLKDVGCRYVIIGHSERRHIPYLAEREELLAMKVVTALAAGLTPILCVGEKLDERDAGKTQAVVKAQLDGGVGALAPADLEKIVIAYEPVWAIGTGRNATPAQAQEVHAFIRGWLRSRSPAAAEKVRIQYGGSVKPDNAVELLGQADVDGALVGGASLKSGDFWAIIKAARR